MTSTFINDSIGIVLQGIPQSKEQLEKLAKIYSSIGEVCISSYSEWKVEGFKFISNDDILKPYSIDGTKVFPKSINYQIITTQRGIEYLKDVGCKWILKLRCDIHIFNLDKHLINWIHKINNVGKFEKSPYDKRIVCFGRNKTKEKNKWYIADYFSFGTSEDMLKYWDIPYVLKPKNLDRRAEEYISTGHVDHKPQGDPLDYFILIPEIAEDVYSYKWNKNLKNTDCSQSNE